MQAGKAELIMGSILLSVELLLVRFHVDPTFQLSAGSADLKAHDAVGNGLVELVQALDAGILHGVLQAGRKVRHKLTDRTKTMSAKALL